MCSVFPIAKDAPFRAGSVATGRPLVVLDALCSGLPDDCTGVRSSPHWHCFLPRCPMGAQAHAPNSPYGCGYLQNAFNRLVHLEIFDAHVIAEHGHAAHSIRQRRMAQHNRRFGKMPLVAFHVGSMADCCA